MLPLILSDHRKQNKSPTILATCIGYFFTDQNTRWKQHEGGPFHLAYSFRELASIIVETAGQNGSVCGSG